MHARIALLGLVALLSEVLHQAVQARPGQHRAEVASSQAALGHMQRGGEATNAGKLQARVTLHAIDDVTGHMDVG
jgi:hypothetical protein